jgi:hypothetical protein
MELKSFVAGIIDDSNGAMLWLQLKCNHCNNDLLKNTAWQWDSLADLVERANNHECGK